MSLNQFPRRSFSGAATLQTFTGNGSTTTYTLSQAQFQNECFVFVDDVAQVPGVDFTINGTTLTFTSAPANTAEIIVRGFGVPTPLNVVSDASVTTAKVADGAITHSKLHTTAIQDKLGYTPVSPTQLTTEINNLINGAPGALNTLDELAAALGDDANYAATITNALATKANTSSLGTLATVSPTGTPDSTKFLRGDNSWQVVAVTPTAVSDQDNTSTGYFDLPAGTTAQRPASPVNGMIRYNTTRNTVEYYNNAWIDVSADLNPFSDITSLSMPHSGINTTEAGGTSAISAYGFAAVSQKSYSNGNFGMHDGHDGSPADYPAYAAIYIGGTYPNGKAVNKLTLTLHGNSFGFFELQGSNDASTSGTFYNTGNWTSLSFTSSGSTLSVQSAGGQNSGYGDGTVLTFRYNNSVAYTHYRLWIKDSSQPGESLGTRYTGWATYYWTLERV